MTKHLKMIFVSSILTRIYHSIRTTTWPVFRIPLINQRQALNVISLAMDTRVSLDVSLNFERQKQAYITKKSFRECKAKLYGLIHCLQLLVQLDYYCINVDLFG